MGATRSKGSTLTGHQGCLPWRAVGSISSSSRRCSFEMQDSRHADVCYVHHILRIMQTSVVTRCSASQSGNLRRPIMGVAWQRLPTYISGMDLWLGSGCLMPTWMNASFRNQFVPTAGQWRE
jgi:hypothetical protein